MGTEYHVKISALPSGQNQQQLHSEIEACMQTVNLQMSTYLPESELSRFNRHNTPDWFDVSEDTATVVAEAIRVSQMSDGAFDVTVGPLVNLWSFGPDARPRHMPSQEEISALQQEIGYGQLEVRRSPPALRKTRPMVYVDLSAIAKGFAVDKVANLLDAKGVEAYMVEIGGEVSTRGSKLDGGPWRIGIERPVTTSRSIHVVVEPGDRALATSGDYRNFFEQDGTLYSHTIDPKTGMPVSHGLASASVIADDCMTADALATALMVLGPEAGFAFAEENHLDVLLISRTADGYTDRWTPGFEEHIVPMEMKP